MDLELLEDLALSEDRAAALAQLLPGSEDHDYFRCLHAQQRGDLDQAERVIAEWPDRHGTNALYHRLTLRQLLYRVMSGTGSAAGAAERAAEDLRDRLGVSHWHEAEVPASEPAARPTRLAPGVFDGAALLARGVEASADLAQVTDEGLYELVDGGLGRGLDGGLDPTRRHVLLDRLHHTPAKQLAALVAGDLDARGHAFGGSRIHAELTLDQLHEVARRRPELTTHAAWIGAVVRRMRPPASVDLGLDRDAREAYLGELWTFVARLPPVTNSLKAHVLWHLLDAQRRRDAKPDRELFAAYLQLPRTAAYALHRDVRGEELVAFGTDFSAITGLWSAGSDEELVRDLVQRRIEDAPRYASWLDRGWLEAVIAEARLLTGTGDIESATRVLGPARAAQLRERVELAWCVHDRTRFAAEESVVLDVDVKHVPELTVNVFRVDPLAYFQHHQKEVGVELDLDGLAASHELVLRFTEPAIRRVRRRIELPMCARPGTYVIDLIGNGIASRAVVHKGRLRFATRVGAAGHVVEVLDEAGHELPGARAWVGAREYVADERGSFVVPFSTAPSTVPMLLIYGELAQVAALAMVAERYELELQLALDRQQLTTGRTAHALARVRLRCGDAPASLALITQPTWDVTVTDRAGVATTKSQPLVLVDHEVAVLEIPLGDDVARVDLAVRGRVGVIAEQREQELVAAETIEVATIHATVATEALFVARTAAGWVLSALGKSGEPRAHRPVNVVLVHRWSRIQLTCELATDPDGRVELGALPGVQRITATLGSTTQTWITDDPELACPALVVDHPARSGSGAGAGEAAPPILVPLPPRRSPAELVRGLSLVELRAGVPMRHVTEAEITPLASAIRIAALAPGDYQLRGPGLLPTRLRVVAPTAIAMRQAVTPTEIVELTRPAPAIVSVTTDHDLVIELAGTTPDTRVHVIATRFLAARTSPFDATDLPLRARPDRARGVDYVSGRELGDEYRYVLDRRTARRYPGVMGDKPSLLLAPWARRTTSTAVADARGGGQFRAGPPARMAAAAPSAAFAPREVAGDADAYAGYDFLAEAPIVVANLVPRDGRIAIPLAALGHATAVTILVDDPGGLVERYAWLAEPALEPRDLRLRVALDPDRHALQRKSIAPLHAGGVLEIRDLATAKVHLLDSVERAHAYLLALRDDAALRDFAWVTRWHALAESERRELYSRHACHELHVFLYFKDHAFFDAVVRPHLAHKRTKTFIDHWLLDADLAPYLEPGQLIQRNAFELALLGRRLRTEPALVRILDDRIALLPPDPATETRLVDALLGAAALEGANELAGLQAEAFGTAALAADLAMVPPPGAPPPAPARSRAAPAAKRKQEARDEAAADADADAETEREVTRGGGSLKADMARRQAEAPMFRAADTTQEWAEHNWFHRTPAQSGADMIVANRLWRDYARHESGEFLSPWFGLATASFAEAMCALAVIDLPFVATPHRMQAEGPELTITTTGNVLAGTSQLVDVPDLAVTGSPIVVGQTYVRADDRFGFEAGEQVDKYVTGPFAAGVVYTCLVVLANPTSSRQRIAALVQIPRGSIAVGGTRATQTIEIALAPYGTHGHESSFYFPAPGRFSHFPVHVSRFDQIIAHAPAQMLEVTAGGEVADPTSWAYLSQHGTLADVVAFLGVANLGGAALDLAKVLWRLRDRAAYIAILAALEQRRVYDTEVWAYALLHRDLPRIRAWLRAEPARLVAAGPEREMIGSDAEAVGLYEHLEFAPLVNARAHKLGSKVRILNDGFARQYRAFLELVAHRPAPTGEDLLAAASYFAAQDRAEAAVATLARVAPVSVTEHMQLAYLAAYAACLTGEPARAHQLVQPWREVPVDRWRTKFAALAAMLDELAGASAQVSDPRNRDQQQGELASRQPAFELAVDRDGLVIQQHHVATLELRYFEMDVELLFSRQPFVQSDVSRFSFIEPGHRDQVTDPAPEHRVPWPPELRGKNVVVEAVGAGLRKARIHYANDLAVNVAHQYGQLRVQRASDRAPLPASYVKVYARRHDGTIAFYKDGYTDLRGWFDYATLSTSDLDHVERFALLVASDRAGAAILEAGPPPR
ncbi:MAG: hypothetical protein ABI467_16725 [Kofleriaceae bacterium]